jgi:hypothetical protein
MPLWMNLIRNDRCFSKKIINEYRLDLQFVRITQNFFVENN